MSHVTSQGEFAPGPTPFLVRPFEGAVTGWIVVTGAMLAELVGGALTNQLFVGAAVLVLLLPIAVTYGFAAAQWQLTRWSGPGPASWWHLGAIAAALFIWLLWPTGPAQLNGAYGSAGAACDVLPTDQTTQCLHLAAQAIDAHNLVWWGTLVLILASAALVRWSRIAVWATLPVALAGVQLATHFLEQLLVHYGVGGPAG
jgi:hypothetical protein